MFGSWGIPNTPEFSQIFYGRFILWCPKKKITAWRRQILKILCIMNDLCEKWLFLNSQKTSIKVNINCQNKTYFSLL